MQERFDVLSYSPLAEEGVFSDERIRAEIYR